jgi:hypothetical protein
MMAALNNGLKKKVTFSELKREHSQIAKEKGIKTAKEYLAA